MGRSRFETKRGRHLENPRKTARQKFFHRKLGGGGEKCPGFASWNEDFHRLQMRFHPRRANQKRSARFLKREVRKKIPGGPLRALSNTHCVDPSRMFDPASEISDFHGVGVSKKIHEIKRYRDESSKRQEKSMDPKFLVLLCCLLPLAQAADPVQTVTGGAIVMTPMPGNGTPTGLGAPGTQNRLNQGNGIYPNDIQRGTDIDRSGGPISDPTNRRMAPPLQGTSQGTGR